MLRAEEVTPGDLWQLLWRHRYALVALALVGAALGYGYSLFVPDRYTAETLVLVEEAELTRSNSRAASTTGLRTRLDTLSEQVLSRTRLEQLVRDYELVSADGRIDQAVAKVRRRIGIDVIDKNGFRLTFTDEEPRMAARVANELAGEFIERTNRALQQQLNSTATGLQQQTDDLLERLRQKDAEIADFRSANLGMLPDQLDSNVDAIERLEQKLRDNSADLRQAQAELDGLPAVASETSPTIVATTAREVARSILGGARQADVDRRLASEHPLVQLEARRLQRDDLLRIYTARHPDVRSLQSQISGLEELVAASPPFEPATTVTGGGISTAQADAAAQRRSIELRISALETERTLALNDLAEYRRRVAGSAAVEQEYRQLQRDQTNLQTNYDRLASRNVEADLANDPDAAAMPTSQFRVIDPAVVPSQPSSPMRLYFLLGGALAGLGLVAGVVFLREAALEPINTASELERFARIDVLASIPVIRTPQLRKRARLVRLSAATAVGSVLVVVFVLRVLMRGA